MKPRILFRQALLAAALFVFAIAPARAANVTMVVPSSLIGQVVYGASGTQYTPDSAGYIAVPQGQDVAGFLAAGFGFAPSGLSPVALKLIDGKTAAGVGLTASASAGIFAITSTPGTSEVLTGEAAESNTKTDNVIFEYVLPANYHAGSNLTLNIHAAYSGSGTAGTVTVAGAAYLAAAAGTQGSTLIATAAQAITTSDAGYAFVITGTGLVPGSRLVLKGTLVIQETGGSATLTGTVDSATIG